MSQENITKRQLLFIKALLQKPSSQEEIIAYITTRDPELGPIDRNKFTRDKSTIENIWQIQIHYNRATDTYTIHAQDLDKNIERLISAYEIIYGLNRPYTTHPHLYLEKTLANQTHYFSAILEAIQHEHLIEFQLNSFEKDSSQRTCAPIAIKEVNHRWYLIGYDSEKKQIRNYGLDRISRLRTLEEKCTPPAYDVEKAYAHAIGIENHNEPQPVILRFDQSQIKYVETLPIHASQVIKNIEEHHFDVHLFVHPTYELKMKILSYAEHVEVLSPSTLRHELKHTIEVLYQKYRKCDEKDGENVRI